jgi:hypothetical protein
MDNQKNKIANNFWKSNEDYAFVFQIYSGNNTLSLLSRIFKIKKNAVHKQIKKLESLGIINKRKDYGRMSWRKNAVYYSINPDFPKYFLPNNALTTNFFVASVSPIQRNLLPFYESLFWFFMEKKSISIKETDSFHTFYSEFVSFLNSERDGFDEYFGKKSQNEKYEYSLEKFLVDNFLGSYIKKPRWDLVITSDDISRAFSNQYPIKQYEFALTQQIKNQLWQLHLNKKEKNNIAKSNQSALFK